MTQGTLNLSNYYSKKEHKHNKEDIQNFSHEHKKEDVTDFSHNHGNISFDGKISGNSKTITKNDCILFADSSDNNTIKNTANITTELIKENTIFNHIGADTPLNQNQINSRINSSIYSIKNSLNEKVTEDDVAEMISDKVTEDDVAEMINSAISTALLDKFYPVGSVYTTTQDIDPAVKFGGGIWRKIEGRFLLASGTSENKTYVNGDTAGSKDAVVVKHNHSSSGHVHSTDSSYSFLIANKNIAARTSVMENAAQSSSGRYYVYTNDKNAVINERNTTASTTVTISEKGEDRTDKNMPPYLVVNVWERIG